MVRPGAVEKNITVVIDHSVPHMDALAPKRTALGMRDCRVVLVSKPVLDQFSVGRNREFPSPCIQALGLEHRSLLHPVLGRRTFKLYVVTEAHVYLFQENARLPDEDDLDA